MTIWTTARLFPTKKKSFNASYLSWIFGCLTFFVIAAVFYRILITTSSFSHVQFINIRGVSLEETLLQKPSFEIQKVSDNTTVLYFTSQHVILGKLKDLTLPLKEENLILWDKKEWKEKLNALSDEKKKIFFPTSLLGLGGNLESELKKNLELIYHIKESISKINNEYGFHKKIETFLVSIQKEE